jgi:hypothetical protein
MDNNTIGTGWRKASYSNHQSNCVEAGNGPGVLVRDTKDPGTVLGFSASAWGEFTRGLKDS